MDFPNLIDAALRFSDVTALVPAGLAGAAALWACGHRRAGIAWAAALVLSTTLAAVLKNALPPFTLGLPWGGLPALSFPSGTAVAASTFFGLLAALAWRMSLASSNIQIWRGATISFAACAAFVVASVHIRHWHPALDIAAGTALGVFATAGFAWTLRRDPPKGRAATIAILSALAASVICQGLRGPADAVILAAFPHAVL